MDAVAIFTSVSHLLSVEFMKMLSKKTKVIKLGGLS